MVKRISIALSSGLRKKIGDGQSVSDELEDLVGTALRVPADIVSTVVDDLSRGACFPYAISIITGFRNTTSFSRYLKDVVAKAERASAYIAEVPRGDRVLSDRKELLFVAVDFYHRGGKWAWVSINVRVEAYKHPVICGVQKREFNQS